MSGFSSPLAHDTNGQPLPGQWPREALEGVGAWAATEPRSDNPYSVRRNPGRYAAWRAGYNAAEDAWRKAGGGFGDGLAAEAFEAILREAGVPDDRIEELLA